jgi:hypothetical protein
MKPGITRLISTALIFSVGTSLAAEGAVSPQATTRTSSMREEVEKTPTTPEN